MKAVFCFGLYDALLGLDAVCICVCVRANMHIFIVCLLCVHTEAPG